MTTHRAVKIVDQNPRLARWIGFVLLLIALGMVGLADAIGWYAGALAVGFAFCAVGMWQYADDRPERLRQRQEEIAKLERSIDA